MTFSPRRPLLRFLRLATPLAALAAISPLGGVGLAHAAPADAVRDAGKHFQRGVALFNEADYAGALVEFKRAYEIAPNPAVLYNIGQTHFQLRSYASALGAFERYLADAGTAAEHRAEALSAVETLRSRVGKIDVVAPDGAEIAIDDEVAGKTPLPPVLAAVGRRKLVATKDGRSSPVRYVEVSAGETAKIELKLEEPAPAATATAPAPAKSLAPPHKNYTPAIIAWSATGVLTAASAVVGVLALKKSSDLDDARNRYDASASVASRTAAIDDAHSKAQTFAIASDILIPLAVVAGGAAVYFTLVPPTKGGASSSSARLRLDVAPTSAGLAGSF